MANKVVEDFLDEDDPISGQKFALVSFLSPENVLEKKELFFFERFLQSYEVEWKVKGLEEFLASKVTAINKELEDKAVQFEKEDKPDLASTCRSARIKIDAVFEDYHAFVRQKQKDLNKTKIGTAWDDFLFKEQSKLEEEFHAKNNFRTSIRGFKVRAVARDEKEAEIRAKKLQGSDKYHNIYCSEVGKWTPWDPKPHMVENHEYAQEELNNLMKKYKENEDHKTTFFDEQRKAGIQESKARSATAAGAVGEQKTSTMTKVEENTVLTPVEVSTSAEVREGLFSGPADLVLERKMAAAAAAAASAEAKTVEEVKAIETKVEEAKVTGETAP
jgi:hypothetical protein